MARAAVKAKQAQKARVQPAPKTRARGRRKHASGGNPNQQLFFVRMRRRAKPMYFILAVLFAATFAFLGVGSGSGGLEQLFTNLNVFHHSGTSISRAEKEVQKNPKSPSGFRDLATAYESHNEPLLAIGALESYLALAPKDAKTWSELGGLQLSAAQTYATQYENETASEQLATPSQAILPSSSSAVGKALGTNPIEHTRATDLNSSIDSLAEQVQSYETSAITSYTKVTKLQPGNANAQFQLAQVAQSAGDYATAVSSYKAYLKLNPNSTSAGEVRSLIKELQAATG
jgi:cytochrome c-type biogenesis protein CcmH/NrfG